MKLNKIYTMAGIGCTNLLASMAMADEATTSKYGGGETPDLPDEVVSLVNTVLGYAKAVGLVVAIGMLTFAGFKYLTAGAGEKAKAKDMFVPLAIGAGLVILAPFIGETIWNALNTNG